MSKASNLKILSTHTFNVPKFSIIDENDYFNDMQKLDNFLKPYDESARFAIRSAADIEDGYLKSFAGIFNTYLNITKSEIKKFIDLCIQNKKDKKVESYCSTFNISKRINMNVIVQEMIYSEVSGVIFTLNPVTQKNEYIIECVYGQGEGLVSGLIKPDQIICDSSSKEILSYKVSFQSYQLRPSLTGLLLESVPVTYLNQSKRKMNKMQIDCMLKNADKIRRIFNTEVDIEWAIMNNNIYILQARPITTIKCKKVGLPLKK